MTPYAYLTVFVSVVLGLAIEQPSADDARGLDPVHSREGDARG